MKRDIRAPKFLDDLFRDMRDRRLLIPAIALVAALVAIPVLLKGSAEPVPPPVSPPVAAEDAAAVQSAVLTEQTGIRNYRDRLEALKRKDPFDQKFVLPPPSSVAIEGGDTETTAPEEISEPASTIDDAAPPATAGSVFDDTIADSTVTEVDETTVDDTTINETVVNEDVSEPAEPKPQTRFYAGRVDVTIGPLGRAKRLENVRYLEFLPDDRAPVVAFLGLAEGAKRAVFSVSRDVAATDGEGSCAPKKPAPCQFLTLKVGEQRTFGYADGKTYRLRLLDTRVVRVPDPRKPEPRGDDRNG